MAELYKHFSHFNFTPAQWREAAERYIALLEAWDRLDDEDAQIDHDALAENFEKCELCEQMSELEDERDEFAKEFAVVWAERLLELTEQKTIKKES